MPANNTSYFELLRHPEWQKKRLKIMERDGFKCQMCRDADTTLNVHHSYYTKGAKPWEYPDESLKCLCEPCHEKVTDVSQRLKHAAGQISYFCVECVYGFAMGFMLADRAAAGDLQSRAQLSADETIAHLQASGLAQVFGILPEDVLANVSADHTISYEKIQAVRRAIDEAAGRSRPEESPDGR